MMDHEIYFGLIESTPDAVLVINNRREIIFINKSAINLFGYTPEQLAGKMIDVLIPQRFRKQHQHYMDTYQAHRLPRPMGVTLELFCLCKDGQELPVSIGLTPISTAKGAFIAIFVRDITSLEKQVIDRTAELHQSNQKLQAEIIERKRIENDLRQLTEKLAQREEQLTNELRSLEKVSNSPDTSLTAEAFGLTPLEKAVPETFAELVERYSEIIDLILDEKTYQVNHQSSDLLRSLTHQLGFLNAKPYDVVSLHANALRQKMINATYAKKKAYIEEGRIVVLQIMGYLVAYYRNHRIGSQYVPDSIKPDAPLENESKKD